MAFRGEVVLHDLGPETRIGHEHCDTRKVPEHDYVFSVLWAAYYPDPGRLIPASGSSGASLATDPKSSPLIRPTRS